MTADIIYSSFDLGSSKITGDFVLKQLGVLNFSRILRVVGRLPLYAVIVQAIVSKPSLSSKGPAASAAYLSMISIMVPFMFVFKYFSGYMLEDIRLDTNILFAVSASIMFVIPFILYSARIRTPVVKMVLGRYLSLRYLGAYQGRRFRPAAVVKVKTPAPLFVDALRGCSLNSVLDRILINIQLAEPD